MDYEIDMSSSNNTVFHQRENNSNNMIIVEQSTDDYFRSQWKSINPFIYKDGSTIPIPDLQPVYEQPITIHTNIKVISYVLCILTILLAIGFSSWTMNNRKTRIVNASQPFFLYMICKFIFCICVRIKMNDSMILYLLIYTFLFHSFWKVLELLSWVRLFSSEIILPIFEYSLNYFVIFSL